jgi:hypothetical protein
MVRQLQATLKALPYKDDFDPDFRRMKYVRYADDFLIGFIGTRAEAEVIRQRLKALRVTVARAGKKPLVAEFGGLSLARVPEGLGLRLEFVFDAAWRTFSNHRSELVQRLLQGACELCGMEGEMEVHHIRQLKDLERTGRAPKAAWERVMSARRRKTLVVCEACHDAIHNGEYDGPRLR